MMQGITSTEENFMEVVLLWNLPGGAHVVREARVNILGGVHPLALVAASTAVLMDTGLGIAKLGTGKISAIGVVKEAILRGTARTVPRI